jgi:ADP-heptose:LPS heptosyltransferase
VVDILVLRALGLGDTLAAVPALRGLRRAVGTSRIVLAGPSGPGELLRRVGVVDEIRPVAGLTPAGLRWEGPAVNLHGRGPQSHRLLHAAGARPVVGFACADAGCAGPPWRQDEPERARWCRLVASRWDVPTDPDDVRLDLMPSARPVDVVVHPGAASGARRWPLDRWAAVVGSLVGREVVVTGSPQERDLGLALARLVGLREDRVLAGRTGIAGLAAVVTSARLVLSGDTGIAHLAYAAGTPSVTIFGPTPPRRWGPPTGPHVAVWKGSGVGDPHATSPDPALLAVRSVDVMAAVDRLAAVTQR